LKFFYHVKLFNNKNATYPSAKAPDHCSKNPRTADPKITKVLLKFQSNESTPGGSKQGNIAARKIKVIGVVFHISLSINMGEKW